MPSDDVTALVALALSGPASDALLDRARDLAQTTRERQIVAIASAYVAGDTDLVDVLARDHLVDHPDSFLVAWISSRPASPTETDMP